MTCPKLFPAAILAAAGALVGLAPNLEASSHREAPLITEMPKVDGTDFYMFNSYERGREGYVTMVANYLPLQDSYGGPNYFSMDPDALYQIHVDNNGDSREDITFRFRFTNVLKDIQLNIGGEMVSVPLINVGPIAAGNTAALNIEEQFTCSVIFGDDPNGQEFPVTNAATGSATFIKPVDNIGNKSIPDYNAYANSHIYTVNVPGCPFPAKLFVGQRKDPFVVNLGETFDLVNTNPLGPVNGEKNTIADKNVTSLILEVPGICLRQGDEFVVGAWTTAMLPRDRMLKADPSFQSPTSESGPYVQVSRLGMPLVNEVVIGIPDKNLFNASHPSGDGQFLTYVTNPTLPALLNVLFGVTPPCLPRNDLVSVFLTGVPGLNQPANVVPSEMLRLNSNIYPSQGGIALVRRGQQNPLGVLGGDLQGFPNGRRPGDDVVDIELRAVMGVLYPDAGDPNGCAPHGNLPFTDGAFVNDTRYLSTFPYLRPPIAGSPN